MIDLLRGSFALLRIVLIGYGAALLAGIAARLLIGRVDLCAWLESFSGIPSKAELSLPVIGELLSRASSTCFALVQNGVDHRSFVVIATGVLLGNVVVSGAVVVARGLFVVPLLLNFVGAFRAGAALCEAALNVDSIPGLIMWCCIAGLVIGEVLFFVPLVVGVVAAESWVVWPSCFGFGDRHSAAVGGAKLFGAACAVMFGLALVHAMLEAAFVLWIEK